MQERIKLFCCVMLCVLNKPGYQDIYDMIKVFKEQSHNTFIDRIDMQMLCRQF